MADLELWTWKNQLQGMMQWEAQMIGSRWKITWGAAILSVTYGSTKKLLRKLAEESGFQAVVVITKASFPNHRKCTDLAGGYDYIFIWYKCAYVHEYLGTCRWPGLGLYDGAHEVGWTSHRFWWRRLTATGATGGRGCSGIPSGRWGKMKIRWRYVAQW